VRTAQYSMTLLAMFYAKPVNRWPGPRSSFGSRTRRLAALELEEQASTAALKTLSDSPEMQDARALDRARQQAGDRENDARTRRSISTMPVTDGSNWIDR